MTFFEKMMVAAGLVSMAVVIWALYFAWCKEHKMQPLDEALAKFRQHPWYGQIILLFCVGA